MNDNIDHYIWEGFYLPDKYVTNGKGSVYATTREECQRRAAENAGVENDGWAKSSHSDEPMYQTGSDDVHIVTVVRRPVYGGSDG